MALNATTILPYDVATVTDAFANEDFLRSISEHVGGSLVSATVEGDTAGAFVLTAVRTMPTDRLPDIAKKFVGATLTVTQKEQWAAPGADGTREAAVELSVGGVPLKVTAVQRLVTVAEGTRVDVDGNVGSSIPFLGDKIAKAAEPMIGKALTIQAGQAGKWIESRKG
ncbi:MULTISPECIES: DUF2505 domain-containing protein [unclassified Arthrobacter]|uniref:DUF2505 domain-containing protein n=1 Tax=unclassified Arthrobacter TaxID=235627 RepID=UPI001D148459|nr:MULTISPECIES: DUF2505 domain-containing protein [unclassified Arthrobacter]MCC3277256.1 DUF2505 domain-containing protein [Arthrobacter sp. zg-Y20]MCC3280197.1 DUF2505 domain-containing protein [Arthrobacter sp. zg-Y40]MCC9178999.1 DUF2505 domain-containing protein [Arthrobacter sp. zg-Y750]MDK1317416.1 DUF2505 domain-containing protein [Arthrobacter sp. zg.Y20]WIB07189.1 DUF2505 domain-containing protein [Arthrobacter sp. zg-Y20]